MAFVDAKVPEPSFETRVFDNGIDGVHQLSPAAVIDGHVEPHAGITRRGVNRVLQLLPCTCGGSPSSRPMQVKRMPLLRNLGKLTAEIHAQEPPPACRPRCAAASSFPPRRA